MDNERRLLQLCGYGINDETLRLAHLVSMNYERFDALLDAIEKLVPIVSHSDFYLTLNCERYMIKIKNDSASEEDLFLLDTDIVVWANEHDIALEEGDEDICIVGFTQERVTDA